MKAHAHIVECIQKMLEQEGPSENLFKYLDVHGYIVAYFENLGEEVKLKVVSTRWHLYPVKKADTISKKEIEEHKYMLAHYYHYTFAFFINDGRIKIDASPKGYEQASGTVFSYKGNDAVAYKIGL